MDPFIPIWLKIAYTAFVAILVPIYFAKYGPVNFLWFSDIALIVTVPALWLENSLLASMMAIGVLLPELVWNLSFFGRLLTGKELTPLTDYMFDAEKPRYLRALSLFHVFLPVLLLWLVAQLGYDPRAWVAQSLLAAVVLPVTYLLSTPEKNVNWVYMAERSERISLHSLVYLGLEIAAFPVAIYLPTHLFLKSLFG